MGEKGGKHSCKCKCSIRESGEGEWERTEENTLVSVNVALKNQEKESGRERRKTLL